MPQKWPKSYPILLHKAVIVKLKIWLVWRLSHPKRACGLETAVFPVYAGLCDVEVEIYREHQERSVLLSRE